MSSPIVKKAKPKQSLAVKLLAVVFSLSAVGAVISYVIYQEWAWREHRRNPDPETPPNTPHVLPISEPVVSENPLASTPEGLSDVIYLLYVNFVTGMLLLIAASSGLGKEFIWPDAPIW